MDEAKEEETINEKERRKEGENTETSRRARTTTKPVRINNHPTSPTTTAPSRPKNGLVQPPDLEISIDLCTSAAVQSSIIGRLKPS